MQAGYFTTVWQDIKNSPGWFGRLLLLALLSFIPVFGIIVVYGYLLAWSRDIAWGVHGPLPAHIFGNEDGKLYSRGFFAWLILLAIGFLLVLLLVVINFAWVLSVGGLSAFVQGGLSMNIFYGLISMFAMLVMFGVGVTLLALALVFAWIGWMRMAIYGRLSAGFQFGKIWAMFRHDAGGMMRIFGMSLLFGVIAGIVGMVIMVMLVVGFALIGAFAVGTGGHVSSGMVMLLLLSMMLGAGIFSYAGVVVVVFNMMLVTRALGYWTRQFGVAQWRGQDDPMPFELAG